jgi:hypothetical protein
MVAASLGLLDCHHASMFTLNCNALNYLLGIVFHSIILLQLSQLEHGSLLLLFYNYFHALILW